MIPTSLAGSPAFAGYYAAMVLTMVFVAAYTAITFHEIALIRSGNSAAAIQIGNGLDRLIPLASAIYHSANLIDCVVWGIVALLTQLIAYGLARLTVPKLMTLTSPRRMWRLRSG